MVDHRLLGIATWWLILLMIVVDGDAADGIGADANIDNKAGDRQTM